MYDSIVTMIPSDWFDVIGALTEEVTALWNSTFPDFWHIWHIWTVSFILIFIAIIFLTNFIVPSFWIKKKLSFAIKVLSNIKKRPDGTVAELSEIAQAMRTESLGHAWKEYTETLHPQREVDDTGQSRIVRWRATTVAETFFSEHAIVGIPLKTEFYKHLPGILTGVGIIGTFLGLIHGLSSFDVSDPTKAQSELRNLINAVGHAFFVSAAAIAIAMLFTWIEKSMVTARNRQVALLRQIIDSLFAAGAGEEYLERLVRASETQATQALHIKDALVADLREILKMLTDRQLEEQSRQTALVLQAQAEHSGRMSQDVGRAIAEHLGGPIAHIAEAVKGVSANQGDAVNKMLTDVLAGFSAQMQDMFGGQMRGMTDILKETSEAMQRSAEKFSTLAANMDSAGKSTVEAMGERLNSAITSMEARQRVMNDQMEKFVTQIRETVSESQTESARKLQETLGQVGQQVAEVVSELRRQAEEAAENQDRRQERFEESTDKVAQTLSVQMEGLLAQSVETNRSLQETVASLSRATGDAITGMNQGAETLYIAASEFAKAGQEVSVTMRLATEATTNLKMSSETITAATSSLGKAFEDYARTRDAFAAMTDSAQKLKETLEQVGEQLSSVVGELRSQSEESAESQGRRIERFEESAGRAVESLSTQVEGLLAQSVETNRSLQETVASLSRTTGDAITRMNQGAETLYIAASDFAKAGQEVTKTIGFATKATDNIKESSERLTVATVATKEAFEDYAITRDSFAAMLTELKSVTDNARRDAAMTSDIVKKIEDATQKLSEAMQQSDDYLARVNEVLFKAHESFSENVTLTLHKGNSQFQKELRTAVDMVSAAVRDLGDTLEDAPGRRR